MNIFIKTIEHKSQRYKTCGDWKIDKDGAILIFVSKMNDWRYEFLVAVHEFCEVFLCRHDGISQKRVDNFDINFERLRKMGNEDEPGDDRRAPYAKQHCIATGVERILAACLGVCWKDYEEKINSL